MGIGHRFSSFVQRTVHHREAEQELDNEVSSYVELLTQEKMRSGISAAEARRAALLEVENPVQVKESVRQARTGAWLEQLVADLRYGVRLLRKNPGFALIVVLTLALGIGANSAIFSVLYTVLLKPLPYSNPQEIVRVWQASHALGFDQLGLTEGQFVSLRDQKRFFSSLGVYQFGRGFINKGDQTENVFLAQASAGVLETLGVQPLLGRGFQRQDEVAGAPPVAILSYELWQHWYGGNEHVLGQTIRINDKTATIVGVLPRGFYLPEDFVGSETIQAWIPRAINTASPRWISYNLTPVARLRPGMSIQETTTESLRPYLEQLYRDHPISGNTLQSVGWDLQIKNVHDDLVGGVRKALWILASAVGLVLLIVCANVASLMLARSGARRKEIAVRAALGAQGHRILRQLLTESMLLSLMGGVLGLLLAQWGIRAIVGLAADNVPRLDQVSLNLPVLLFTLGISLLAGLIFGSLPALQASKPNLGPALVQEGRGTSQGPAGNRAQRVLVVAEVAVAVVLVTSAGLVLRSFERMLHTDPGFRTQGTLALEVDLPPTRYSNANEVAAFNNRAVARVRGLPGVEEAAITSDPPLSGAGDDTVFDMEGQSAPNMQQHLYLWQITPDYFKTMGIPLLSGRELQSSDEADRAPVVVINDQMARQFWPGRSPLGQHIRLYSDPATRGEWAEIVGVVRNAPMRRLSEDILPAVFMTYAQGKQITPWLMGTSLVVRSSQDPRLLLAAIRKQIHEVDSSVVVRRPQTGNELIGQTVSQSHFNLVLLGLFAFVALVLAAVGIYGILANMVRQRSREIGIRMAMGALRSDIFRLVVGRGMRLAFTGLGIGVVLALLSARLMAGLIFGVAPTDPLTYVLVVALLSTIAFLACYVPARKATRLDPMITLRYE